MKHPRFEPGGNGHPSQAEGRQPTAPGVKLKAAAIAGVLLLGAACAKEATPPETKSFDDRITQIAAEENATLLVSGTGSGKHELEQTLTREEGKFTLFWDAEGEVKPKGVTFWLLKDGSVQLGPLIQESEGGGNDIAPYHGTVTANEILVEGVDKGVEWAALMMPPQLDELKP